MDDFRRDVEAQLDPKRHRGLSCNWGDNAPGARQCKEKGCTVRSQHLFSGYCTEHAVQHGIPLITVEPDGADGECNGDGCNKNNR